VIDNYLKVMLSLDKRFGTVAIFTTTNASPCRAAWTLDILSIFQGTPSEPAFQNFVRDVNLVQNSSLSIVNVDNWYKFLSTYLLDTIDPTPQNLSDSQLFGLPSVLVSRDATSSGRFKSLFKKKLYECKFSGKCASQWLVHDLTGNVGSPQDENVSISPGLRTALFNWFVPYNTSDTEMKEAYTIGNYSYFSESAYTMDGWQDRYWGKNYPRLQQIKKNMIQMEFFGVDTVWNFPLEILHQKIKAAVSLTLTVEHSSEVEKI